MGYRWFCLGHGCSAIDFLDRSVDTLFASHAIAAFPERNLPVAQRFGFRYILYRTIAFPDECLLLYHRDYFEYQLDKLGVEIGVNIKLQHEDIFNKMHRI